MKTILVLGGYGGTGRLFCKYLLKETQFNVIIAGRNQAKAEALATELKLTFPAKRISVRYAEASDIKSLHDAFQGIEMVLVAATTTAWAVQIAEAALAMNIDYLDIYFQQDVYPALAGLHERTTKAGRCFITQAGFHPGLRAAYVRKGAEYFDLYQKANIAFAMNVRIEKPESVYELVGLAADYKADVFKDGRWRTATYKDTINIDFGEPFGKRSCMPMDMIEIRNMPEMFGLKEVGVYTTGFNWFVDYLLFPLMMLTQIIRRGAFRHFWASSLVWGLNTFSRKDEGVVFLLEAEGEKDGKRRKIRIMSEHESAYDFTVIPVVACLKQYLDGSICRPGLWMMGQVVDSTRLLADMENMGVLFKQTISD